LLELSRTLSKGRDRVVTLRITEKSVSHSAYGETVCPWVNRYYPNLHIVIFQTWRSRPGEMPETAASSMLII
jgi:hypothetical protein